MADSKIPIKSIQFKAYSVLGKSCLKDVEGARCFPTSATCQLIKGFFSTEQMSFNMFEIIKGSINKCLTASRLVEDWENDMRLPAIMLPGKKKWMFIAIAL